MKKGFTLFNDSLGILDELTDEQAGKLFKAIRNFNCGNEYELDQLLRVCFAPFKNQFLRSGIGLSALEISKINKINRKQRKSNESNESVHYSNSNSNLIVEVISYLNDKLKSDFSPKTINTRKHISARISEGRTIDDFKKVIDTKFSEWVGTDFAKHLKPDTLFGSKFEGYLNQGKITKIEKPSKSKLVFDEQGNLITNNPY